MRASCPHQAGEGSEGILLTTAVGQFALPLFEIVTAAGTPVAGIGGGAVVAGNPVQAPFATDRRPNPPAAIQGVGDLLYATFLGGGLGTMALPSRWTPAARPM